MSVCRWGAARIEIRAAPIQCKKGAATEAKGNTPAVKWVLHSATAIVDHAEGHGDRVYEAVCKLGLEGIVSKRLTSVYKSGPSKAWLKIKNPKAPAATRAADGSF